MIKSNSLFYQLIVVLCFVNIFQCLECRTARPSRCRFNSTCVFGSEICNRSSSNIRGGIFCTALIKSSTDIIVEDMGCMYDQETTKKCQNQTQCFMKFTNQQKKFLHCCCDQHLCNLNLNLSNPDLDPISIDSFDDRYNRTNSGRKWCEESFCWKMILIGFSVVVVLIILISICLTNLNESNPMKTYFSHLIRGKDEKTTKKKNRYPTKEKDPIDLESSTQFLSQQEQKLKKPIDLNDLMIDSSILKQGRFSQISHGIYQKQSVALKIFQDNSPNQSIFNVFNHEKEIYFLPFIEHQNLLKFYGYYIGENLYYLIFEYAENGSLRDYLRSNLVENENELISMCQQISNGIEYLHQDFRGKSSLSKEEIRAPIAHRDLKSDNILRFVSNRLVICDFAMSIQLDETQVSIHDQQQVGTPRYMAPEILVGTVGTEPNALLLSDVYGLALIFWEILSRCSTIEHNETYLMPYEEQLMEKSFNRNPSINEMLQIVNMESPFNRPNIRSSWRKLEKISEIVRTIEQCWNQIPEGRINSSLVAYRMRQFSVSN